MAKDHGAAAEALGELESAADKLGEWLQTNFRLVLAVVVGLLVLAGAGSWLASSRKSDEQDASAALAKTRDDYLSAMGVGPGAIEVPELANPEAASQIRSEYIERYGTVAGEHPGTVSGTLAALESARLSGEDGQDEDALKVLEETLGSAPSGGSVRGMVLQRVAQRLEAAGRWSDAASRHAEAAELPEYPLRAWALADAARCRAMAGEPEAALALYERLQAEHPGLRLPEHQRSQSRELQASQGE